MYRIKTTFPVISIFYLDSFYDFPCTQNLQGEDGIPGEAGTPGSPGLPGNAIPVTTDYVTFH